MGIIIIIVSRVNRSKIWKSFRYLLSWLLCQYKYTGLSTLSSLLRIWVEDFGTRKFYLLPVKKDQKVPSDSQLSVTLYSNCESIAYIHLKIEATTWLITDWIHHSLTNLLVLITRIAFEKTQWWCHFRYW